MGRRNFKTKRDRRMHNLVWYGPAEDQSLLLVGADSETEKDTEIRYPAI